MGFFRRKPKPSNKPDVRTTVAPLGFKRIMVYNVANLQGMGARERQEDAFGFVNVTDLNLIKKKGMLAIVCDGMGGMNDGSLASETAVDSIRAEFDSFDYNEDLTEQLCKAVINAGEKVYKLLNGYGGSTAIVCLFYNEALYYVSVGDSYLFLKRGDELSLINRMHTVFTDNCLETLNKGIADPSSVIMDDKPEAVTQFLGKGEIDDIDGFRIPLKLQPDDRVLICSDGVGSVLDQNEIMLCLNEQSPSQSCSSIEKLISDKALPYQDNYTALVIKCEI